MLSDINLTSLFKGGDRMSDQKDHGYNNHSRPEPDSQDEKRHEEDKKHHPDRDRSHQHDKSQHENQNGKE